MNHITSRRSPGPGKQVQPFGIWGELTNNAGLLIEEIGNDHLDIRAVGSFDADAVPRVAARLQQLAASAGHLRIDFRNVIDVDPAIASLVRRAATTAEAAGGTLNVVGLNESFYQADRTTPIADAHDEPRTHRDTV